MIEKGFYFGRLYLYAKTNWPVFIPGRPKPFAATLKLTERCNCKCITCNYWREPRQDKLDTQKAIDLIQQVRKARVSRLRFSGGEPLMRKDFFEILDAVRPLGFSKVTMASNGLVVKQKADAINDSCLTDLGVSVDGMGETNDRIRGVQGYFARVMEGLKLLQNKRITIMTTLNNQLPKELPQLLEICEREGYLWDYNLPDNSIYFLKDTEIDDIWPSVAESDEIFRILDGARNMRCTRRLSEVKLRYARKYLRKETVTEPHCFMGLMELFVDSGGNILSGCNFFPPVGNILEKPLKEIFASKEYKSRIRNMLARKCQGCTCGYGVNEVAENLPTYLWRTLLDRREMA